MITAATLSNSTLTVVFDNGQEIHSETSSHPKWTELVEAYRRGDEGALRELFSMAKIVEKFSEGGLTVSNNSIFYQGLQLNGIDVDRVLAFLRQGLPYQPIANYMVRKFKNPSRRSIEEMYNFLEHKNMPLTPEGKIIAYKGVQKDFFSVSSGNEPLLQGRRNEEGQIFNGIGETIEMNRSFVNDDYMQGCSSGLHAGSLQYARDWANQHDGIIILIEIDPADVVSVPDECDCSKLRCCKYKVLNKYGGPLPDTFTAEDYTEPEDVVPVSTEDPASTEDDASNQCDGCGESFEDCTCNPCPDCGYLVDSCQCKESLEELNECTVCGNLIANCKCKIGEKAAVSPDVVPTSDNPLQVKADTELRTKVCAILSEQTGIEVSRMVDNANLVKDFGMDSLDLVELAMAGEEEFGVEISDEEAEACHTVADVVNLVKKLTTLHPKKQQQKKFEEGYKEGHRDGTRRRARKYFNDDELNQPADMYHYVLGYNQGYRDARSGITK